MQENEVEKENETDSPETAGLDNSEKKKKRTFIIIGILLILIIIATVVYFLTKNNGNVETITVSTQDLQEVIEVSGGVLSERDVTLKAPAAGNITSINTPENTRVATGAVLLSIDGEQARLQLEQARVNAENARALAATEVDSARKALDEAVERKRANNETLQLQIDKARNRLQFLSEELQRSQNLYNAGAIPEQTLDNQRQQVEQAEIDLQAAIENLEKVESEDTEIINMRNRLTQAETNLENSIRQGNAAVKLAEEAIKNTVVNAPFAGSVTNWQVDRGDYSTPGATLGRFQDLLDIHLRLPVNELDLPKLRKQSPVEIVFDSYPDKTYKGRISEISQSSIADAESVQVFPVKIKFDNPDNLIKPGMSGDARIIVNESKGVLAVPLTAIIRKENNIYVEVLDKNGQQKEVRIIPGINNLEYLEVKSGLYEGDQIIVPKTDE